ncbi:MAG: NapC/NirT family cytochrome c [Terriglobia bacterium]
MTRLSERLVEARRHFNLLMRLSKNPISLMGIVLTTVSGIMILVLMFMGFLDYLANPYVGIITFLILPAFFVTGLLLIPIGIWRTKRQRVRLLAAGSAVPELQFPIWNFNDARVRRIATFVIVASVVNVLLLSTATYKGIHYMESVAFCGTVCHVVMKPEYTTHENSPHSRVSCASCHIGPGAPWFVKSKLSGVRQVVAVALHTYSTPIETPVRNLRPARDTCEQCHWPEKFHDDRVKVIQKYKDDEKNTPITTALLLKVGGARDGAGNGSGIHWWHMAQVNKVTYIADEKREKIFWVEHQNVKGEDTVFELENSGVSPQELSKYEKRVMDCVDCHNRPTHIYKLPEEAVDQAITSHQMDVSLPFIKKEGVILLKANYPDETEALRQIESGLKAYYQNQFPQISQNKQLAIQQAITALQEIYSRNVFPRMKVTWGTYPNHLGHENFPGCFRCHDDSHKSKTGKTITQDCGACHDLLAVEEEKPLTAISEVLQGKSPAP